MHLVCVYMHGVHAEDGASNSLIVVTVTGKQLVLSTVFWREVWISLLFRSLCLTNNEIVTTVIFPKEFHKLLFFLCVCQTLTKRLPVGAGQCSVPGMEVTWPPKAWGLPDTGHVTWTAALQKRKAVSEHNYIVGLRQRLWGLPRIPSGWSLPVASQRQN